MFLEPPSHKTLSAGREHLLVPLISFVFWILLLDFVPNFRSWICLSPGHYVPTYHLSSVKMHRFLSSMALLLLLLVACIACVQAMPSSSSSLWQRKPPRTKPLGKARQGTRWQGDQWQKNHWQGPILDGVSSRRFSQPAATDVNPTLDVDGCIPTRCSMLLLAFPFMQGAVSCCQSPLLSALSSPPFPSPVLSSPLECTTCGSDVHDHVRRSSQESNQSCLRILVHIVVRYALGQDG